MSMKSCVMAGWLMTVSVGNAIVVVFAEARLTENMVRRTVLCHACVSFVTVLCHACVSFVTVLCHAM